MKVLDETMSHFDALRFHWMILTENVLSYLFIVNIGDWLCHQFYKPPK
jgi:hypothetical protein